MIYVIEIHEHNIRFFTYDERWNYGEFIPVRNERMVSVFKWIDFDGKIMVF
jgi:hypothetical protein